MGMRREQKQKQKIRNKKKGEKEKEKGKKKLVSALDDVHRKEVSVPGSNQVQTSVQYEE